MPARLSLMSWLNRLSTPLWVLMRRTLAPHMVSASAAFSTSASRSWKAASSMVTLPCIPRRLLGLEESACTLKPEAK
ncbi:hypothetical protein D3C79_730150 [compost metagenome]